MGKSSLEVVPKNADIGSLELGYEDFLAIDIECASPLSKADARKLHTLYDGWRARVEKASKKLAREDGDELLPIRFDAFSVSGAHGRGGASRFLDAGDACRWLVRELAKLPGVVKVTFGEEDVPAVPKEGARAATSASGANLKKQVADLFGDEAVSVNVLGCISIRFSGDGLASPKKALAPLIEEAVRLAGDVGSIWVRGTWGVHGSLAEVNQGRDLREKPGRALLDQIFADVARMPETDADPFIAHLVLSDGPRPERKAGSWTTGSRVAATFGVELRLHAKDDSRERGGHLEIYVPLADLDDAARREAWVAFGRSAFTALRGEIGSFGLALWMEELTPDDLPLELFAQHPFVAVPRIVGDHAGGFNFPDLSRSVLEGFFEPPWIAWTSNALGARVAKFAGTRTVFGPSIELRVEEPAPLEVDAARYARYRDAWSALEPLRIRWASADYSDDVYPWRRALDRFDAPSLARLGEYLKKRRDDAATMCKLHHSSTWAARHHEGKKAFTEAEQALALGAGPDAYETLLEAVSCFGGKGKPNLKIARDVIAKAMPFADAAPRIPLLAAKLFVLLGEREEALRTLGAITPRDPDELEADPAFAPLHADDRFRHAFGWAKIATMEGLRAQGAKPELKAFPKLAKAIGRNPALFAPGASKKALADAERALGLTLPAVYRSMLEAFDGAVFRDGREVLYGTEELVARNPSPSWGLAVGRNLVLHHPQVKKGEAPLSEPFSGKRVERTPLYWKTLDACLDALVRGPK